jgi:hypothetical protein
MLCMLHTSAARIILSHRVHERLRKGTANTKASHGDPACRQPKMTAEELEQFEKAKEELAQVEQDMAKIRSLTAAEDVILRLRKQQASELKTSEHECNDAVEQARTWTKALQEVYEKRTKKLSDHMIKIDKSDAVMKVHASCPESVARTSCTWHVLQLRVRICAGMVSLVVRILSRATLCRQPALSRLTHVELRFMAVLLKKHV